MFPPDSPICKLQSLERGWDGFYAPPFSEQVLVRANELWYAVLANTREEHCQPNVLACRHHLTVEVEYESHSVLKEFQTIGEWFLLNKRGMKAKSDKLSKLIGGKLVAEIDELIPFRNRQSKAAREYWEATRFKNECLKLKPYINKELFWLLVETGRVRIGDKNYGVTCNKLKEQARLEIVSSILGEYNMFL